MPLCRDIAKCLSTFTKSVIRKYLISVTYFRVTWYLFNTVIQETATWWIIHLSVTRKCQILLLCWAMQPIGEFNEGERVVWLLHSEGVLGASCKVSFPENRKINRIWRSKKMLNRISFPFMNSHKIQIDFEMKGIEDLVDSLINCVPGHELPERTAVRRHAGRKWSYKKNHA